MRRTRRSAVGIGVAATALAAGVVALLTLGGLRAPSHPAPGVDGAPQLDRAVAVITAGDDGAGCVEVVEADGTSRDLDCAAGPVWSLSWTRDDAIVADRQGGDVVRIDPRSGAMTGARPNESVSWDDRWGPDTRSGRRVETSGTFRTESSVVVTDPDGDRTELLTSPRPRTYRFDAAWWAADGRHVLVLDSADRLLVLDSDRPGAAALWIEDVTSADLAPSPDA